MLKKNSEERQKWFFRTLSIIGLAVIVVLCVSLIRESYSRNKISSRVSGLSKQAESLKEQNNELQYKIDNWNSTGELEASARTQLGLKKAGEKAFVVMRPDSGQATSTAEDIVITNNDDLVALSKTNKTNDSNPQKWWKYFFH